MSLTYFCVSLWGVHWAWQAHPVPFASPRARLRWGGVGGDATVCTPGHYENCHVPYDATDVSVGTLPLGSAWRKGPIPAAPWSHSKCVAFCLNFDFSCCGAGCAWACLDGGRIPSAHRT